MARFSSYCLFISLMIILPMFLSFNSGAEDAFDPSKVKSLNQLCKTLNVHYQKFGNNSLWNVSAVSAVRMATQRGPGLIIVVGGILLVLLLVAALYLNNTPPSASEPITVEPVNTITEVEEEGVDGDLPKLTTKKQIEKMEEAKAKEQNEEEYFWTVALGKDVRKKERVEKEKDRQKLQNKRKGTSDW